MEGMLNGFQSDLSSISSEIQMLQSQSIAMNVRLKNRQAVRGELSQFVDEMVVCEAMIKCAHVAHAHCYSHYNTSTRRLPLQSHLGDAGVGARVSRAAS